MTLKHCSTCKETTTHSGNVVPKPGTTYNDYDFNFVWRCFTCNTDQPRRRKKAKAANSMNAVNCLGMWNKIMDEAR